MNVQGHSLRVIVIVSSIFLFVAVSIYVFWLFLPLGSYIRINDQPLSYMLTLSRVRFARDGFLSIHPVSYVGYEPVIARTMFFPRGTYTDVPLDVVPPAWREFVQDRQLTVVIGMFEDTNRNGMFDPGLDRQASSVFGFPVRVTVDLSVAQPIVAGCITGISDGFDGTSHDSDRWDSTSGVSQNDALLLQLQQQDFATAVLKPAISGDFLLTADVSSFQKDPRVSQAQMIISVSPVSGGLGYEFRWQKDGNGSYIVNTLSQDGGDPDAERVYVDPDSFMNIQLMQRNGFGVLSIDDGGGMRELWVMPEAITQPVRIGFTVHRIGEGQVSALVDNVFLTCP